MRNIFLSILIIFFNFIAQNVIADESIDQKKLDGVNNNSSSIELFRGYRFLVKYDILNTKYHFNHPFLFDKIQNSKNNSLVYGIGYQVIYLNKLGFAPNLNIRKISSRSINDSYLLSFEVNLTYGLTKKSYISGGYSYNLSNLDPKNAHFDVKDSFGPGLQVSYGYKLNKNFALESTFSRISTKGLGTINAVEFKTSFLDLGLVVNF